MSEQEYIDATNLAKLRIVRDALHDCIFVRVDDQVPIDLVRKEVSRMIENLTKRVQLSTDAAAS
jgi:hypothetical protein